MYKSEFNQRSRTTMWNMYVCVCRDWSVCGMYGMCGMWCVCVVCECPSLQIFVVMRQRTKEHTLV